MTAAVAVVGASLAGLSAARALRAQSCDGRIVVIGDEQHAPYDRPPLSEEFLAGTCAREDVALGTAADEAPPPPGRSGCHSTSGAAPIPTTSPFRTPGRSSTAAAYSSAGTRRDGDQVRVVEGSCADRSLLAVHVRDGRPSPSSGVDQPARSPAGDGSCGPPSPRSPDHRIGPGTHRTGRRTTSAPRRSTT